MGSCRFTVRIYVSQILSSSLQSSSPQNHQELFNLRHAQLRNVVERIFGVSKRKFPILDQGTEFPLKTQTTLILAFLVIFTFNRIYDEESDDDFEPERDARIAMRETMEQGESFASRMRQLDVEETGALSGSVTPLEKNRADTRRDQIALAMWQSYQEELTRRSEL